MKKNRIIACIMILTMLLTSGVGNIGSVLTSFAQGKSNIIITDILNDKPIPTLDNKFLLEQNIEKISDTQLKINLKITGNNQDVNMKNASIVNTLCDNLEICTESVIVSGIENSKDIKWKITSHRDKVTIDLGDISSKEVNISFEAKIRNGAKVGERIPLNLKADIKYMLDDSEEEVVSSFPIPKFTLVENVQTVEPKEEPKVQTLADDARMNLKTYSTRQTTKNTDTLPFPVTIRDFNADYIFFEVDNDVIGVGDASRGRYGMVDGYGMYGMVGDTIIPKNAILDDRNPTITEAKINDMVSLIDKNKSKLELKLVDENGQTIYAKPEDIFKEKGNLIQAENFYKGLNSTTSYNDIKPTPSGKTDDKRLNTIYKYVYYYVNNLFVDTKGLNTKENITKKHLELSKLDPEDQQNDLYTFSADSKGFFPIDGEGFGEEFNNNKGQTHNYHFTLESHSQFWFDPSTMGENKTLSFEFEGDDDVWVYIDGKLVIDLGGQHGSLKQSITIDEDGNITNSALGNIPDKKLNTEKYRNTYSLKNNDKGYVAQLPGKGMYKFDFFFIERHTTESNFKITTNIKFNPEIVANKEAYINDIEEKYNDTEYAYPGDTIYYKFEATNKGNIPLSNIEFLDDELGIKITEDGIFEKNNSGQYEEINPLPSDLHLKITKKNKNKHTIDKDGNIIDKDGNIIDKDGNIIGNDNTATPEDQLSKLSSLNEGESISIESKTLLKYKVKDTDLTGDNPQKSNTVVISAKYIDMSGELKDIDPDEATVSVKINPYYLKIKKIVEDNNKTPDDNIGFTITVSGNDGTIYNVKLNSNEECTLKNLKYGVVYTISELPIMNYQLNGITIDKQTENDTNKPQVTMDPSTNGALVTVNNRKSNDKWYTDSAITPNKITLKKSNS